MDGIIISRKRHVYQLLILFWRIEMHASYTSQSGCLAKEGEKI